MATFSVTDLSARSLSEVTDLSPKSSFSQQEAKTLKSINDLSGRVLTNAISKQYPKSTFFQVVFSKTSASEILPFRVSFESIGVKSYDNQYVPPVGIQVIGFNNYIL
jgi:hypothetical protein